MRFYNNIGGFQFSRWHPFLTSPRDIIAIHLNNIGNLTIRIIGPNKLWIRHDYYYYYYYVTHFPSPPVWVLFKGIRSVAIHLGNPEIYELVINIGFYDCFYMSSSFLLYP